MKMSTANSHIHARHHPHLRHHDLSSSFSQEEGTQKATTTTTTTTALFRHPSPLSTGLSTTIKSNRRKSVRRAPTATIVSPSVSTSLSLSGPAVLVRDLCSTDVLSGRVSHVSEREYGSERGSLALQRELELRVSETQVLLRALDEFFLTTVVILK